MALGEQDVFGLHIPMDDPAPMRVSERVRDLARDLEDVRYRQLTFLEEASAERFPRDVGHDVVEEVPRPPRIEQRKDVWVVQVGRDADFAEETLGRQRDAEFRSEHLDRDIPVVLQVPGEVDQRHPAATRSEEHTSELQSQSNLVCRLLLEKNKHHPQGDSRSRPAASRPKALPRSTLILAYPEPRLHVRHPPRSSRSATLAHVCLSNTHILP